MHTHTLIALYDATPAEAHLADSSLSALAHELGAALATTGIGLIARPGSALAVAALSAHEGKGVTTIALSPAGSRHEHEHAYRLDHGTHATIYTGRGALGADKSALASAQGMVILGSDEALLSGILDYARGHDLPIAILSSEHPVAVHERVHERDQVLARDVFVSHDPTLLARELALRLRRRNLGHMLR